MTTSVQIAIMSHLSDAQHLMMAGMVKDANTHINFAKLLVNRYDDTTEEVEYSTLDEIWQIAETFTNKRK